MSTEYGLHCRTCKVSSGYSFNHHPDIAQSLIGIAPLAIRIKEMEPSGLLEIGILGDYEGVFQFAIDHCGDKHDLIVEDEYGNLYGADGSKCGENKQES